MTAVTSTKNLDLVKSLGADHGIDYTKEGFTKNGQTPTGNNLSGES